jgi:Mycobacterial 4 TMS phage holin, superfamily IV
VIRFLISTAFLAGANALGLLVAVLALDDMTTTFTSFLIEVAIFTGVTAVIRPFIMKLALQHFDALLGGTALISVLIGLIVTTALTSGLVIDGTGTWLLATIIVWLVSVLAGVLLPLLILRRGLQNAGDRRANVG